MKGFKRVRGNSNSGSASGRHPAGKSRLGGMVALFMLFGSTIPAQAAGPLADAWGALLAYVPQRATVLSAPARIEGKTTAAAWTERLRAYDVWIDRASRRFQVPGAIIRGVIVRESGGNPKARAPTTSAKGLMQTIDSTFAQARTRLVARGVRITDPLDPQDSIRAGS